ncbi:MAG: PEP-CTERM sorting domain-containing protein [Candidatus Nealsonbacteria bacterium]|nr:PEP-CTERM sorting domain-containing protein [Candidatus Nealsonbacteria bacterium]
MRYLTLGAVILLLPCVCAADVTINVGSHTLLPDTPNQKIPIYVVADDGAPVVSGVNMHVQVADGGPEYTTGVPPGSIDGPIITYVQIVDDVTTPGYSEFHTTDYGPTIFGAHGNHGHLSTHGVLPQLYIESAALQAGSTAPAGLLAILTIDTTGFHETDGPWDLVLSQAGAKPSTDLLEDYISGSEMLVRPIDMTIVDGQISVPEPSTFVLLLVAGLGYVCWRRRRDRV